MSKTQIATGGIADDAVTSAKTELGLITMVDQFRLTADVTGTNADITSNLERIDTPTTPLIGSGVTNSSGIFSFPSTGIYLIIVNAMFSNPNTTSSIDGQCGVLTKVTIDNSSYTERARAFGGFDGTTNDRISSGASSLLLDVTDTSNVKCKFTTTTLNSDSALQGNTDANRTSFLFIRLGDT